MPWLFGTLIESKHSLAPADSFNPCTLGAFHYPLSASMALVDLNLTSYSFSQIHIPVYRTSFL